MTVQYMQLQYEEYKELEHQMREFKETTHKSVEGFYHKSIRLQINPNLIMEFLGPLVLAGQAILEPEAPGALEHPTTGVVTHHVPPAVPDETPAVDGEGRLILCAEHPGGHDWMPVPSGGWLCKRCGVRKSGGM